jgi:hygromycin-B 4-O-kinase
MRKTSLPPAAILRFLQTRFSPGVSQLEPLIEGEESQAFAFMAADKPYVVRINPSAEGFQKDAYAYRHFNSEAVPIPQVYQIGVIDQRHAFCISARMPGRTLQAADAATVRRLLAPTLQVWMAISTIDISATTGFGDFDSSGAGRFASWRAYLGSFLDPAAYDWPAIMAQLDRSRARQLIGTFQALVPRVPDLRALVHGDFGSNNLLTDGRQITAVLDWDSAKYGDPLLDIATASFWSPWLDCMQALADYGEQRLATLPNYRERMLCYQLWIGLREIYDNALRGDTRMLTWLQQRSVDILDSYCITGLTR